MEGRPGRAGFPFHRFVLQCWRGQKANKDNNSEKKVGDRMGAAETKVPAIEMKGIT